MAQNKDINFITQPSEDFSCPVCLSILQEPFLTICCGGHFCKACIQTVKRQHNECPMCKKSPLLSVIDKYFKRQLERLMVYCPQEGCQWTGEYGEVNKHLAIGQLAGDCRYVHVKCPLSCGQEISRKSLDSHTEDHCPCRSASCPYCDFEGTHQVVTTLHRDVCPNYPCACPNSCSLGFIKRCNMSDHLTQCPEQEIPCVFLEMGCEKVVHRKHLKEHLEMNIVEHQMLTCKAFLTMELKAQRRMEAMQQQHRLEIAAIRDRFAQMEAKVGQAEYWVNGFKLMAEEVKKNNWTVYLSRMNEIVSSMSPAVTPVIIGLPNITVSDDLKHSHSIPFYTHSRGYKMLLYAKAVYDHKNLLQMSFINLEKQAIMVSLCIAKGEYDEYLEWPLQGKATILLLNSQQDDKHREAVYNFTAARYTDDKLVQSLAHKPTQNFKCNKKQARYNPYKFGGNRGIFYSEVGPSCDSYHHQCKPVVESVEFSYDNNDAAASYFKGDHIYFKVTIETDSVST